MSNGLKIMMFRILRNNNKKMGFGSQNNRVMIMKVVYSVVGMMVVGMMVVGMMVVVMVVMVVMAVVMAVVIDNNI